VSAYAIGKASRLHNTEFAEFRNSQFPAMIPRLFLANDALDSRSEVPHSAFCSPNFVLFRKGLQTFRETRSEAEVLRSNDFRLFRLR
jgi:hypothetical protein